MEKSNKIKIFGDIISPENFLYDLTRWPAVLPMLMFFRPKIFYPFGKPDKKGKLMVSSNHIGALDWVRIGFVFPFRRFWTVTRIECFNNKFNTFVFDKALNCLPVDRENFSMDTYHRILDLLKMNKMVLFFSEGRLNFKNNNVQEFKMGTVFFSVMSGASIIPVYLVKQDNYLKRCHIVVGEIFNPKDYCEGTPSIGDIARINEELRNKECELGQWHDSYIKSKKDK